MTRGLKSLCFKISYGEPSGAESSRVFMDKLRLDTDWLPTITRFWAKTECVWQCIKIRNGKQLCISIGHRVFHCKKTGSWVY